ncbi:MAG TPA: hypothetical protein V6D12_09820 [Candidatus Obscuribacterales bacterium]
MDNRAVNGAIAITQYGKKDILETICQHFCRQILGVMSGRLFGFVLRI